MTTAVHQSQVQDSDALAFERRETDRWPVEGVATIFHLGGESFGQMHTLKMLDYSNDGVGAICPDPVTPGSLVSIGFQSPGYPAKRGSVVHCTPCGEGYRICIAFEFNLAA